MARLKLTILLPLYHNPDKNGKRKKIIGREFLDTYKELIKKFGGCTVDPHTLSGGWINPDTGIEVTDELTAYWILYKNTKENIKFLKKYKKVLKMRFKQDDIMMYSVSITQF